MRSKTSIRGHKTRPGKKLNTSKRGSRSMKLGGVQISARLQKPTRPARGVKRKHAAAEPIVEPHPVAAGNAAAAESRRIVETLPMVQPAAFHAAEKPHAGSGLAAWSLAICAIAITGVLLFVGRPAYAPGNTAQPKTPEATPESNRGMIKPPSKALTAEIVPDEPVPPQLVVDLPVQPGPVFGKLDEQLTDASLGPVEQPALVTITGCLDSDRDTFTLKDTAGVDAPSSRNWRTGFLKKRRASIEIVDAVSGLSLQNHVGQRVSLTGSLVDRDMQVRSLRRVAASCKG